MKPIFFIAIILILVTGCTTYKCYPSKKSRDYSTVKKVKQGWQVTTRHPFKKWTREIYECNPCETVKP